MMNRICIVSDCMFSLMGTFHRELLILIGRGVNDRYCRNVLSGQGMSVVTYKRETLPATH